MYFFAPLDSNIRESFKVFKSTYVNLHTVADNRKFKVLLTFNLKLPCTLVFILLKFDSSTDRQMVSSPVCRAHFATFSIVNTKRWVKTPAILCHSFRNILLSYSWLNIDSFTGVLWKGQWETTFSGVITIVHRCDGQTDSRLAREKRSCFRKQTAGIKSDHKRHGTETRESVFGLQVHTI